MKGKVLVEKLKKLISKFCNKNHTTCFIDKCCGKDWTLCSKNHDDGYIYNTRNTTKEVIDDEFYDCLKRRTWKGLAWLMYSAVKYSPIGKYYWNKYSKRRLKDGQL